MFTSSNKNKSNQHAAADVPIVNSNVFDNDSLNSFFDVLSNLVSVGDDAKSISSKVSELIAAGMLPQDALLHVTPPEALPTANLDAVLAEHGSAQSSLTNSAAISSNSKKVGSKKDGTSTKNSLFTQGKTDTTGEALLRYILKHSVPSKGSTLLLSPIVKLLSDTYKLPSLTSTTETAEDLAQGLAVMQIEQSSFGLLKSIESMLGVLNSLRGSANGIALNVSNYQKVFNSIMSKPNQQTLQGHLTTVMPYFDALLADPEAAAYFNGLVPRLSTWRQLVASTGHFKVPFHFYLGFVLQLIKFAQFHDQLVESLHLWVDTTGTTYDYTALMVNISKFSESMAFFDFKVHDHFYTLPSPDFVHHSVHFDFKAFLVLQHMHLHDLRGVDNLPPLGQMCASLPLELKALLTSLISQRKLADVPAALQAACNLIPNIQQCLAPLHVRQERFIMLDLGLYFTFGKDAFRNIVNVDTFGSHAGTFPPHSYHELLELREWLETFPQKGDYAISYTQRLIQILVDTAAHQPYAHQQERFTIAAKLLGYDPTVIRGMLRAWLSQLTATSFTHPSPFYALFTFTGVYPCDHPLFVLALFSHLRKTASPTFRSDDLYAMECSMDPLLGYKTGIFPNINISPFLYQAFQPLMRERSNFTSRALHVFYAALRNAPPGELTYGPKRNLLFPDNASPTLLPVTDVRQIKNHMLAMNPKALDDAMQTQLQHLEAQQSILLKPKGGDIMSGSKPTSLDTDTVINGDRNEPKEEQMQPSTVLTSRDALTEGSDSSNSESGRSGSNKDSHPDLQAISSSDSSDNEQAGNVVVVSNDDNSSLDEDQWIREYAISPILDDQPGNENIVGAHTILHLMTLANVIGSDNSVDGSTADNEQKDEESSEEGQEESSGSEGGDTNNQGNLGRRKRDDDDDSGSQKGNSEGAQQLAGGVSSNTTTTQPRSKPPSKRKSSDKDSHGHEDSEDLPSGMQPAHTEGLTTTRNEAYRRTSQPTATDTAANEAVAIEVVPNDETTSVAPNPSRASRTVCVANYKDGNDLVMYTAVLITKYTGTNQVSYMKCFEVVHGYVISEGKGIITESVLLDQCVLTGQAEFQAEFVACMTQVHNPYAEIIDNVEEQIPQAFRHRYRNDSEAQMVTKWFAYAQAYLYHAEQKHLIETGQCITIRNTELVGRIISTLPMITSTSDDVRSMQKTEFLKLMSHMVHKDGTRWYGEPRAFNIHNSFRGARGTPYFSCRENHIFRPLYTYPADAMDWRFATIALLDLYPVYLHVIGDNIDTRLLAFINRYDQHGRCRAFDVNNTIIFPAGHSAFIYDTNELTVLISRDVLNILGRDMVVRRNGRRLQFPEYAKLLRNDAVPPGNRLVRWVAEFQDRVHSPFRLSWRHALTEEWESACARYHLRLESIVVHFVNWLAHERRSRRFLRPPQISPIFVRLRSGYGWVQAERFGVKLPRAPITLHWQLNRHFVVTIFKYARNQALSLPRATEGNAEFTNSEDGVSVDNRYIEVPELITLDLESDSDD